MKAPDVNKHFIISIIKSSVRMLGCILGFINPLYVFVLFFIAELLGIVEEIL